MIRVKGTVQGVGFRPAVWHLAGECGLRGSVRNDSEGVLILAWGTLESLNTFVKRLTDEPPPLARIVKIERILLNNNNNNGRSPSSFRIAGSRDGAMGTDVAPDAATCADCLAEVMDPSSRRWRYPFTSCTHCGPRFSIVKEIPYDRVNTSMAPFVLCQACRAEYNNPAHRCFHAQSNACAECGPKLWLEDETGARVESSRESDSINMAVRLIRDGLIVAVKGVGGFHLACDACNNQAVDRLRQRKHRYHKPFALMARNIDMIRWYVDVSEHEKDVLESPAAPVVVLEVCGKRSVAPAVAPDQKTLGFMLPYTPLHHLLMQEVESPIVLTSGNRSNEPQCIDNNEARQRLRGIVDYWLIHNRDIVSRLDDSVVRVVAGRPRFLRRSRGYVPVSVDLPTDFKDLPPVLAMGGQLKNTFCLLREGRAYFSQHMGDLEDAAVFREYQRNLSLYRQLFDFNPSIIAVDLHPDYLSTQLGFELAEKKGRALAEVQHHHAHIGACLAEYGLPLDMKPVLGVVLDGLGLGDDTTLWGGEFLLADYRSYRRLAHFRPVPMIGGTQATREPWRNTYAHLQLALGWEWVKKKFGELALIRYLTEKPLKNINVMIEKKLNSPLTSSCGRLFDGVSAALGVCRESVSYDGQAAVELEALAAPVFDKEAKDRYPFRQRTNNGLIVIDWGVMWEALLKDLQSGIEPSVIAARFHRVVIMAVAETAWKLSLAQKIDTVVLSGGVFQNRLLLEGVSSWLQGRGVTVLIAEKTPVNDGGLSLGQAVVAAARARL